MSSKPAGAWGKRLRTMLTTGIAFAVNYGTLLVLTPYITNTIGTEAYGFVSLAKQFASYATILTMALNTFAVRYVSLEYHKQDYRRASTYYSSVFFGEFFIATILVALSGIGILHMEHWIHIPAAIVDDVKILFALVMLGFWATSIGTVFESGSYIANKLDIVGICKTCSYIANAAAMLLLFTFCTPNVLYVGIGNIVAVGIMVATNYIISKRHTPKLRISPRLFSLRAVRELVVGGVWSSLNSVGDLLNNGLDLLVGNQLLSSMAMGQIAIAKTMYTVTQGIYIIVDQMFIPAFLQSYAAGDEKRLRSEFNTSMNVSGLFTNLFFAGFVALGMPFYRRWIPGQDIDVIYKLTVITILTCIPTGAVHPLYYAYTLTVKKKVPCMVTIIGGICNVAGMYVLIRYFHCGVYAVAWTTAVVMAVINFVTNPLYIAHVMQYPLTTFYPTIAKNVCSCAILTGVFFAISSLISPASWGMILLTAALLIFIGIPLHLLVVCGRSERRKIIDRLAKRWIRER